MNLGLFIVGTLIRTLFCVVFFFVFATLLFGAPLTWNSVLIFAIISAIFQAFHQTRK